MQYNYAVKFIPNVGYRFTRNRRSLVVGIMSSGEILSPEQHLSSANISQEHLRAVQQDGPLSVPEEVAAGSPSMASHVMTSIDFVEPPEGPLFKYVSNQTWEYIQRGSFQFGSAEYYRKTENLLIKDRLEGLSEVSLAHGEDRATIFLTSGFNSAIFCGTSEVGGQDHQRMMDSFGGGGGKCLRINPVCEFLAQVKRRTRPFRARIHDVIYTDAKAFVIDHPDASPFRQIIRTGPVVLNDINKRFFSTFYEVGLLPSLYAKPTAYSHERERRLIFEFRDDLRQPTLILEDKNLLDFVTVIDSSSATTNG